MQTSSNTKLKILYLADIFRFETDEDHALSINELIIKLSNFDITVSRQTLYEDVALLKKYGMDIYTNRQAGRAPTLYNLINRDFSLSELKLLVEIIQSSQITTPPQSKELICRLSTLTSKYQAKQLECWGNAKL